jgi:hypothetical protein
MKLFYGISLIQCSLHRSYSGNFGSEVAEAWLMHGEQKTLAQGNIGQLLTVLRLKSQGSE